ncbi:hypothetical protein LR68_00365 [Anoxybacillus sp. BCO1]|nr:hypothetical protein LR68_00365 [Anoxybacillus sp. BCO1]
MNMQEIKQRLQTICDETDEWFQQLLHDERKGVQRLVQQWYKQKENRKTRTGTFFAYVAI